MDLVKKAFDEKEMPMLLLLANKMDLLHMQAVKTEQHEAFAKANKVHASYYVSAKTGDSISSCFYKIAAELAGIEVPKSVMESLSQYQVKAQVQNPQEQNVQN